MECYQFDKRLVTEIVQKKDELNLGFSGLVLGEDYLIAGVDEAGRGPLAGPVVTAAVILPSSPQIYGLKDSKEIPAEQREALYIEILDKAIATGVSVIEPAEIDELNILSATMKGMRQALQKLEIKPNLVVVDGNRTPRSGYVEKPIVKGDSKSAAIMAASVLAKVTRDQIMIELHEKYPDYGFDQHKGYGASTHLEAIKKYGPCPAHRQSFEPIRSMVQGKQTTLI